MTNLNLLTLTITALLASSVNSLALSRRQSSNSSRIVYCKPGTAVTVEDSCAGIPQLAVIWSTSVTPAPKEVISLAELAVRGAGGNVTAEYTIEGFSGFAAHAPLPVLELIEYVGRSYNFSMEQDCIVSVAKTVEGGPVKRSV